MIKFFCASNNSELVYKNILNNPFLKNHEIEIQYDHNREKGLPERYNELIDRNLTSDSWLVFLHDDVELLEDIGPLLESASKNIIYGACGAKKINGKGEIIGRIKAQDHRLNNGGKFTFGLLATGRYEIVPTFDPFFICVHSTLCNRVFDRVVLGDATYVFGNQVFDSNLSYHLFSEELNINAKKNYGIQSAVLQINCCHYSWGTKTPEYYQALEYIKKKHRIKRFIGTCEKDCMNDSEAEDWE